MKSSFYTMRAWYHPLMLARFAMNYYMFVCVLLFLFQNKLLYPNWLTGAILSRDEAARKAAAVNLVPWGQPGPGGNVLQGYVPADFSQPAPRGTIVVFHGNGNCAYDREFYVGAFSQRGFRTFLYEYPGYGGRPGSPCAASIVGDAQALIRKLNQSGLGPIYVWGESLGAGIAPAVCSDTTLPVRGLVLATPWDSLTHAAQIHYPFAPVSILLSDKYDSIANLAHFTHPVCVICGTLDPVLPSRLGLNLFAHLPEAKKLILKDGYGHGNWPVSPELDWWDDVLNFVAPPVALAKH